MKCEISRCYKCNKEGYIIPSNNPLVPGICQNCLNKSLDVSRVEHFTFFCRTFNLPFNPTLYINIYNRQKTNTFRTYVEELVETKEFSFEDRVSDKWAEVEKEWSKIKTYQDMLLKIRPIRESFEERGRLKWGADKTFAELVQLENLFINTIKMYNITDPMRLDAIKKACKVSIAIDELIESGEAKSIKDYTAAYQSFLKVAQIDELGQVASEGAIKTVADLYKYMEKNGFVFTFYDKEERDIVDRTINDIKQSIKQEILNATGLTTQFEEMVDKFRKKEEEEIESIAYAETPLHELLGADDAYDVIEAETDDALANEDFDFSEFDYDDD